MRGFSASLPRTHIGGFFQWGTTKVIGCRHIETTLGRRWMSVRPSAAGGQTDLPPRRKVTIQHLQHLRNTGTPISMLTAYDFPTARACDTQRVDITLVGDSLAQVCLGLSSTTVLTLEEMIHHCRAVARGTTHPFLVADMPFGTYQAGVNDAVKNAVRIIKEGGVEAVKLEGGEEILDVVQRLTVVGVPVMAHVGLMPQRHVAMSGYRVQGRDASSAKGVLDAAKKLEDAGAFAVVLEAIPHRLGKYITDQLTIPTIGIGAGPGTSGQVLVWDDVMTRWHGKKAKFVRRFADVGGEEAKGVSNFVEAVRNGDFPREKEEGYEIDEGEWEKFLNEKVERREVENRTS